MSSSRRVQGVLLVLFAGVCGALAASYDYVTVSTGIDHSGGTMLVLVSCLLMIFGAAAVLMLGSGLVVRVFGLLILLDIIGTGFAAYMLESTLIMGAMAIAAVGWVLRLAGRSRGQPHVQTV